MVAELTVLDEGNYAVQGDLDLVSVADLWQTSERLFPQQPPQRIDLAGVSRADSAGVALLVAWLGQARRRQQPLRFINLPAQMQAIIQVTDLEQLLPLA
jgi:phospholipid transport system transporter-binding protein